MLSFLVFTGAAQNALPQVYPLYQDSTAFTLGSNYYQILEDSGGQYSINDVSGSLLSKKFHAPGPLKNDWAGIKYWWLRARVQNKMKTPAQILLNSDGEQTDYYLLTADSTWQHMKTGILVPWSKKSGYKRSNYLPVDIMPGGGLLVYKRVMFNYLFSSKQPVLRWWVGAREPFVEYLSEGEIYYFDLCSAVMFGITMLAFLLNSLFFSIVKEKVYLYFALFVLGEAGSVFYKYIADIFNNHPYLVFIGGISSVLYRLFLLLFLRDFLQLKIYRKRWDRFLLALGYFAMASYFARFVFYLFLASGRGISLLWLMETPADILTACMFVTLLFFFKNKDRHIRLAVISAMPACFCWGIVYPLAYYFKQWSLTDNLFYNGFYNWFYQWISVVEIAIVSWCVSVFTWSLLLKYADLKKEIVQRQLAKELEMRLLTEKQNAELERQVEGRTADLNKSIHELKAAQKQLIQSEKMASLGELTAGIAHEIQNPLNFVNNFSEVNQELLAELDEELEKGQIEEAKLIAGDIKQNEQKINLHGKRADAIVKGMLQHSRTTTGQKELTDINALADEYLRLSYHGLRAKDKTFNAEIHTNFDESIGLLNIVPQDIGRVLLNLFNNAFYAVSEKAKTAGAGYKPAVSVSTKNEGDKVTVTVGDNGNGIPEKIKDKIFQPFFTTKPAGQGTGLGLSLTYDIVKAHGGSIHAETVEGEFTEFTILLPL